MRFAVPVLLVMLSLTPRGVHAQVDESELGGWYMYFFAKEFADGPWGIQGDIQFRNWNVIGDLEQLLIRGGLTYTPSSRDILFTGGYASITSGEYGDSDDTSSENRVYQEALLPQKIASRFFLRHRFRFEQRWVEDQDFRTRYRYALFADIPLNQTTMERGAVYLALYDEIFINGQRDIGNGARVEYFDRNRLYGAIGYAVRDQLRIQAGYMRQTTNSIDKGQLQLSLHHKW
jgi:hypothetical protein